MTDMYLMIMGQTKRIMVDVRDVRLLNERTVKKKKKQRHKGRDGGASIDAGWAPLIV